MSYRSRAKKRRYKRIEARARKGRNRENATRWFLTLAGRPGRFDCCRVQFKRGDRIVYRHDPRTIRCERHALEDPDSARFRTSLRFDNARRAAA